MFLDELISSDFFLISRVLKALPGNLFRRKELIEIHEVTDKKFSNFIQHTSI